MEEYQEQAPEAQEGREEELSRRVEEGNQAKELLSNQFLIDRVLGEVVMDLNNRILQCNPANAQDRDNFVVLQSARLATLDVTNRLNMFVELGKQAQAELDGEVPSRGGGLL